MSALKESISRINNVAFFKHFIAFLNYLKESKAKLTQTKNLNLRAMDEIAQFIPKPDHFTEKHPLRTELEWRYLELIDILAQLKKFASSRKGFRVLTKHGREYLQKPVEDKYFELFLAYWEKLNWAYLFNCADDKPAEILQMAREYVARTMLGFKKSQESYIDYHEFAEFLRLDLDLKVINYRNEELPDRARDCVRDVLIKPLALFGVLDLKEEKGEYGYGKLTGFKLTDLGESVLRVVCPEDDMINIFPAYGGNPNLN